MLIKNIIKFSTLNRFTLVFSELNRAGIPIAEALDTTIDMIDNLPLKEKLQTVIESIVFISACYVYSERTARFSTAASLAFQNDSFVTNFLTNCQSN